MVSPRFALVYCPSNYRITQLMIIEAIYQFVSSYKVQAIDITGLFEYTPVIFVNVEFPELSTFNLVYS